ncbi:MAG: S49 family peptidase [Planctomycetota bacterium]|nr:S49 family peptidase [Planctomycetota bacterium]
MQVVNRPASFGRLFGAFLTGLSVVGGIFLTGVTIGAVLVGAAGFWAADRGMDQYVLWSTYREGGSDTVAIIPIVGEIDAPRAEFVRLCVEDVLDDSSVKAVVLRIVSGGGGVTASDETSHQIERLREDGLPVVASFGSVAASGAYYISCHADYIVAQQTCITGSIGVMAQIMTFEGLLDKVGVEPVTLVSSDSPKKHIANDIFRSWNEEDREEIIALLDASHELFRTRVREGRREATNEPAQFERITSGVVFTAGEALSYKLIDGIGYLDDAIARAEQLAGIPTGSATVMRLRERPVFLGGLPFLEAESTARRGPLDAERIRSLVNELRTVRLMYRVH